MLDLELDQVWAELGDRKRYFRIVKLNKAFALCVVGGWDRTHNQIKWMKRNVWVRFALFKTYRLESPRV